MDVATCRRAILSLISSAELQHEARGSEIILLLHSKLEISFHKETSIHSFLDYAVSAKCENNNAAEGVKLWKIMFFSLICRVQRSH